MYAWVVRLCGFFTIQCRCQQPVILKCPKRLKHDLQSTRHTYIDTLSLWLPINAQKQQHQIINFGGSIPHLSLISSFMRTHPTHELL